MGRNLESRLQALERLVPREYQAFGPDSEVTIRGDMPALPWFTGCVALLESKGRLDEKRTLRKVLRRTVGRDSSGGRLYEVVEGLFD